jgi:SAM-dependent methyltransferase
MEIELQRELPDPPAELLRLVGGPMEIGQSHVDDMRRFSYLLPDERVLDVGSGIGRTARWLTPYLTEGSYEGFDINPGSVAWCKQEITSRYPNFRFTHLDLFNAAYNPNGQLRAEELTFPYADGEFDVVCLFSVFTHLMPADLERYLAESHRVLKPGGRIHASCFLLNAERPSLPAPDSDGVATAFDVAEWMVAYEEQSLRERFRKAAFDLHIISYGTWAENGLQGAGEGTQDVMAAALDPTAR